MKLRKRKKREKEREEEGKGDRTGWRMSGDRKVRERNA